MDTSTHEIITAELSLSTVTDAEVLPNLLKQTCRKVLEVSGDGAYDMTQGIATRPAISCKKLYGYHKRSLSGTAMYRVKSYSVGD